MTLDSEWFEDKMQEFMADYDYDEDEDIDLNDGMHTCAGE